MAIFMPEIAVNKRLPLTFKRLFWEIGISKLIVRFVGF